MRVGHIPALTWNRVRANYAEVPDLSVPEAALGVRQQELPEGVTQRELTQEEASAWLLQHAPKETAESVVAGKKPTYHPQTFGTGLGAEYDELVKTTDAPVSFLEIAPDTAPKEVILREIDCPGNQSAVLGQLIHVGAGARATLLMILRSAEAAEGTAALSTKIVLEKGAGLQLISAQRLGDRFVLFDDTGAALCEDAALRVVQIALGAGRVYTGMQPEMVGDRSLFEAKMSWLGRDDRFLDINYNAVQRGKRTRTVMNFDGVLLDRSEKTFRGTIDFRRGCCGSTGNEKENVLLLSNDAVNKTLPIILCEEEDMEGSHGATIGRLGEDILFYLASRGISAKEAERMMVSARLGSACAQVPDERIRKELMEVVEEAAAE